MTRTTAGAAAGNATRPTPTTSISTARRPDSAARRSASWATSLLASQRSVDDGDDLAAELIQGGRPSGLEMIRRQAYGPHHGTPRRRALPRECARAGARRPA